jgi:hypothetical protein
MQTEILDTRSWQTRIELAAAMAKYIDIFHNTLRRHSSLDMLTPTEFETINVNRVRVAQQRSNQRGQHQVDYFPGSCQCDRGGRTSSVYEPGVSSPLALW